MKKKFNHHTHTTYSDGKAEMEYFVEEAVKQKFELLGFSEHSPLPFLNGFSIKENQIQNYVEDIAYYQKKYPEIKLYKSLEFDFIPGVSSDFQAISKRYQLDYAIGGVHLVKSDMDDQLWFIDGPLVETYNDGLEYLFGGNIKKAVGAYFNQLNTMTDTQYFQVIAHMDKIKMHNKNRYFNESEKWYIGHIDESLQLIKEKNIIVEVNTRGKYKKRSDSFFPDRKVLRKIRKMNIPVTVSSDAHKPGEISSGFNEAYELLKQEGFKEIMKFNGKEFIPVEF